jgi:membrane-associated phospholipid phosphatase
MPERRCPHSSAAASAANGASVASTATVQRAFPVSRGPTPRTRNLIGRLIVAAVLLWGLMASIGYLLTHQLRNSGLERWDAAVDRSFAAHRGGFFNTGTHLATFGAETYVVIALGLVAAVSLRLALHRWRESIFLAVALFGEVTIFVSTTLVVHRARPAVARLDSAPPTSSFPSGHTAASVTLYGGLAVLIFFASRRRWLRAVFLAVGVLVPTAVALSRVYRGMHYPSDVLGGALLALIWLAVTGSVLFSGVGRVPRQDARMSAVGA